jgi:hypothetical protein
MAVLYLKRSKTFHQPGNSSRKFFSLETSVRKQIEGDIMKNKCSFSLTTLLFSALTFLSVQTPAQTATTNIRGLRVDPSYFYGTYSGQSVTTIASDVVSKAKANGANTLFVYAYNSVYGAFYPTTYTQSAVEGGYGSQNILSALTTAAKSNSMKVVAVVPVNNFKSVWDKNPAWRVKNKAGADYKPFSDTYLLSAHSAGFKAWLKGFYQDLLAKNPNVDGIEAVEPTVDYYWAKDADYNPDATTQYKAAYPAGTLGDQNWLNMRAKAMTDLIQILTSSAGAVGKNSYLVQTMPAKSDGTLFSSTVLKNNIGLDLDGIMALTGTSKLTYLMGELIWQQWAAEYGTTKFSPTWTRGASQAFISYVAGRTTPLVHVEVSSFSGSVGTVTPTLTEFKSSLDSIKDLGVGIDVYDFSQIVKKSAWTSLSTWSSTTTVTPTPTPSPSPSPTPSPVTCASTTKTITSAANSSGQTQTCTASLPTSNTSTTPVVATVTNGGSYSLICQSTGAWATTPSTSSCPAPAVTAVYCPATTKTITSPANSAGQTQTCTATLPKSLPGTITATVTNGGSYSIVCQTSGAWASSATSSSCPAPAVASPTPAPSGQIYGITIDQIGSLSAIVTSLKNLAHKPTTRIVFDEGVAPSYYTSAASQIHAVSFIMGEILDSFYMKDITTSAYGQRTTDYMNALGSNVDIWEVGNEINGEWLGTTSDVVAKMTTSYNIVKGAGKKAALTLYYNQDCWANSANEMFTWANKNVPASMKSGLDYVLISYYEDDCNNLQPDWQTVFAKLATMFPNSKIGFGETGTNKSGSKASYITRYYNMTINQPNYVGGYFWWYGWQDFVPMSNPLWTTLNTAIQ